MKTTTPTQRARRKPVRRAQGGAHHPIPTVVLEPREADREALACLLCRILFTQVSAAAFVHWAAGLLGWLKR